LLTDVKVNIEANNNTINENQNAYLGTFIASTKSFIEFFISNNAFSPRSFATMPIIRFMKYVVKQKMHIELIYLQEVNRELALAQSLLVIYQY